MSDPQTPLAWGIQLSKLWMMSGQSFPVDVAAIATTVTKQRFEDPVGLVTPHGIPGIDGMLSRRKLNGDWCISYDEAVTSPGRINFTLAHELGHYLLHRKLRDQFSCGQGDVLGFDQADARRIELEANVFASYLLMPANDFRTTMGTSAFTLEALRAGADRYCTSLTATALKFVELTEQPVILVMARDGFVCWSMVSRAARLVRGYLPPGTPVSDEASSADPTGERVGSGVWHRDYAAEQFMLASDAYDLTIFLVRLIDARHVVHDEDEPQDSYDFMSNRFDGKPE